MVAYLVCIGLSLATAVFVERKSRQQQPIRGGAMSYLLHYLLVTIAVATPLLVIVTAIQFGFLRAVVVAVGLSALTYGTAFCLSLLEYPVTETADS